MIFSNITRLCTNTTFAERVHTTVLRTILVVKHRLIVLLGLEHNVV
jgi:hypothetical protein